MDSSQLGVLVLACAVVLVTVPSAPALAADEVTLTVTVVDGAGQPVEDATLTVSWNDTETEARTAGNGKAFVDVPAGARVTIEVSHPRFVRNWPYVVANATERDVTVDVAARGSLRVAVSDAEGPLADTHVVVRNDGRIVANGRTDGDGVFESGAVERGEYHVTAVKSGYYRVESEVTVNGSAAWRPTLESGSVSLTVGVVDPHFDPPRPLSGVSAQVDDVATVRTLADGEATVSVPVNSEFAVRFSKEGYRTVERRVAVGESATSLSANVSRTPSLTVEPLNRRVVVGESVVVRVVDEYGERVPRATVYVDGEAAGRTDGDGERVVDIDSAGDHEISAERDGVRAEGVVVTGVSDRTPTPSPSATATPSPTATPEPTATPTATPTPTDEPSTAPVPGFSLALATLSILGFALLESRRRA